MSVESIDDTEDLYRAAVGLRRADYYVPKFLRFDEPGASRVSWNWPAFFGAFYWFLYRRMYGYWAVFSVLIPIAAIIGAGIVDAICKNSRVTLATSLTVLAFSYLIVPMYANALYHRKIRRRIEKMRRRVPDPAAQVAALEKGPHTNPIIFWALLPFLVIVPAILAAIAIPAYQQYAIRSQVIESLALARPLERAVVDRYVVERQWPTGLADLGIAQPPSGKYVASIQLDRGTLSITFGNQAARLISGRVLSLRPTIVASNRVVWTCGYAAPPGGDPEPGTAGPQRTNVAAPDLPRVCLRKGAR